MANSREVQRKADAKRAGKRARAWTAMVYPESAKEGWMDILRDQLIECLVSPLHDSDVWQPEDEMDDPNHVAGTPKKAHYHVVLSFKNPTTYDRAREVFEAIGASIPPESKCRVRDFKQMARYLCHLDQPEKHRYEPHDVTSIGSIDYPSLVMNSMDEDTMLDEIFDAMDMYALDSYPKVVRWARENNPEWKTIVYRKYTRQISEYAKGLHYELQEQRREESRSRLSGGTPGLCYYDTQTRSSKFQVPENSGSEGSEQVL